MKDVGPILIRGTNWIGDSVMSLAALRELRRLYPKCHISLLVTPWVLGLFEGQGLVDKIIPFQSSGSTWQDLRSLRKQLRHFQTVVLFQNAFRAAAIAFFSGIPERIGYATDGRSLLLTRRARPRIKKLKRHQTYHYLDLLYQTGLSSHNYLKETTFIPDIHLDISQKGSKHIDELLQASGPSSGGPLVVINPGAYYGTAKRWFIDRYAVLADRLIDDIKAEIVLVGSPEEIPLAQKIQALSKHPLKVLTGQTDLQSLMSLLSRCDLFVTNDSGPMHLAASLDTPQIALFGSTDEVATGPFSARAHVLHKHVECSPCLLRECPIDLRCFSKITVDEVYNAARAIL
ncbi:MAG: lipopolysaccharide heptosyltransferase II [Acidobacteriota bacterium]|nr:lipopolysaccharide heptosyltransferase II [Acidobacteriota bacterium]